MSPTKTRTGTTRIAAATTAAVALLFSLLALFAAAPAARAEHGDGSELGYDGSYSYLRTLDGSATLIQGDTGTRDAIEINQPILAGDRLWVAPRSRAEIVLSDGNLLRLDGDSEAVFEHLAGSPDTADQTTVLRLREGNVQVVVASDAGGDGLPRIETANATVYLRSAGSYRITTTAGEWTEIVVRDGYAEVVTDRGTVAARPDEEVVVDGASWPRTTLRVAGAVDGLERWGSGLEQRLAANQVPYVDESLRYEAAPLADYGSWVDIRGSWAWRPRVGADWRPYWQGRWTSTPVGLTWVSSEPWGWVPYHYGTWDNSPGFGWVWFPGNRFATAWVYWYWGPSYTAWVPVGYYTRHYDPYYRSGFRYGVYGWAGGDWGLFADWVFCPTGYFGSRHQERYLHDGRNWDRRHGADRVPRGVITTDTRGITPDRWHKPDEVMTVLRTRPSELARADGAGKPRGLRGADLELPDVTPFVARRDTLPAEVRSRVLVNDAGGRKLAGTPLVPSSLGRTARPAAGVRPAGLLRGRDGGEVGGAVRPAGDAGTSTPAGRPAVVRAAPRAEVDRPSDPRAASPRVVRPADRGRPAPSGEGDRPARVTFRPQGPARGAESPVAERPVVLRPRSDDGATPAARPRERSAAPRPEVVRPIERPVDRPAAVRPPTVRPGAGLEPRSRTGGGTPPSAPRAIVVRPGPESVRPQAPAAGRPVPQRPAPSAGGPTPRSAPPPPRVERATPRPSPSPPPRASSPDRGSTQAPAKEKARSAGGDKASGSGARATRPRDRD